MAELIFSISPTQVEKECCLFIALVLSRAQWLIRTIRNLYMPTFSNKILQLHEQLNYKYVKDEYINILEKYLESNKETI